MKYTSLLLAKILFSSTIISTSNAQQIFSYDFQGSNVGSWDASWNIYSSYAVMTDNRSLESIDGNRGAAGAEYGFGAGQITGVNNSFMFTNLGSSSATIRETWIPWRLSSGGFGGGADETLRMGLVSDGSYNFVDPGSDSFFLSGTETQRSNFGSTVTSTLSLAYRNESGAELYNFGEITLDAANGTTGSYIYAYDITQEFTPGSAEGLFNINLNIEQWQIGIGLATMDVDMGSIASYSVSDLDSGLLSSTLANARVGLGYNILSGGATDRIYYDGFITTTGGGAPEASVSLFALLAAPLTLLRRRK